MLIHRSFRVLAALLFVACTCAARGQSPLAIGFEQAFTPDFEQRDLRTFRTALDLDEGQVAVVESLFADYQEQFEQALAVVRNDFRDVQALLGSEDPAIDQEREELRGRIAGMLEEMRDELQALPPGASPNEIQRKYEQEVKAIQDRLESLQTPPMEAEQVRKVFDDATSRLAAWNQQKRALADRFTADVQGRLQGEGVDLIAMTAEVGKDETLRQAIAQTLEDYAARLDAALRARNDGLQSTQAALFQAVRDQDRPALQRTLQQQVAWRVAVRNVNDETAQALATALAASDESQSARFLATFRQRAYPQVFRSTQTQRLLKAAQEIPGVTPEQAEAVKSMLQQFETDLAPMTERLLQTVRHHEPEVYCLREERRIMPPGPDQEEVERDRGLDPIQKVLAERNELGAKYSTQLEALLGADLYERLPRGRGAVEIPGADEEDSSDDSED
jgi:hypothetical protein